MKTKFGIVGCGFLGNIVADAWKTGLLPDYELVGVTSRTRASAEKTAETVGCAVCDDVDALLALEPEYIVETASVEAVRAMAVPVLKNGVNLVIISIGAFADLDFYEQVKAAAVEGGAKVHLASGAIGGFDVLQTVTLMAEAQKLAETAGIETHTGAKGFRNTPVWADHLLTDTEKTTVFTGNAKQAIAAFPRRVNVAVATSLATTGPEITGILHGFGMPMLRDEPVEITGLKAGIIGLGVSGKMIADALQFMGADIAYYSRTRKPDAEAVGMAYKPLAQLLTESEVVFTCLNKNVLLLGKDEFAQLGAGKVLFNTSIGPGFDSAALEQWLALPGTHFFCDTRAAAGPVGENFFARENVHCANVSAGRTKQAFVLLSQKVLANIRTALGE